MTMDSVKEMIEFSTSHLSISLTHLGGLLGVTEKTIYDWKKKQIGDLPPKGKRLLRLVEVIKCIEQENGGQHKGAAVMDVLQNGRVAMDGDDEDSNSIALIGYITAFPEENGWRGNVKVALGEYSRYRSQKQG